MAVDSDTQRWPKLPAEWKTTMATTPPVVLYVYHCTKCGQHGHLHMEETATEVTTACSMCGAEVLAEWDGGVELATDRPD
jgi:hypothetical protein